MLQALQNFDDFRLKRRVQLSAANIPEHSVQTVFNRHSIAAQTAFNQCCDIHSRPRHSHDQPHAHKWPYFRAFSRASAFLSSTDQRPPQATDAAHADVHAIKKAALQARPHTIQFQSNLLSNQPLRKSKQNPSKCTFRFFGHFTTSRRNSLKHRGFRPPTAHSTLHVSFYRPYLGIPSFDTTL